VLDVNSNKSSWREPIIVTSEHLRFCGASLLNLKYKFLFIINIIIINFIYNNYEAIKWKEAHKRLLFCKNDKPGSVTLRYRSMLVIYLAPASQRESSSLPITKVRATLCIAFLQHLVTYLALQHIRFAMRSALLHNRWSLTPPFHPYHALLHGGIFSVALSVNPTLY
jgi:hypothetical protein